MAIVKIWLDEKKIIIILSLSNSLSPCHYILFVIQLIYLPSHDEHRQIMLAFRPNSQCSTRCDNDHYLAPFESAETIDNSWFSILSTVNIVWFPYIYNIFMLQFQYDSCFFFGSFFPLWTNDDELADKSIEQKIIALLL